VIFGTLGMLLGGYLYEDHNVKFRLDGMHPGSFILLVSAALTSVIALPAMVARRRTDKVWPLRWLRIAALIFTFLNALVDFATEGFGALLNISIGLFTLAILSYQIEAAARRQLSPEVSPA
jgi:hypothetical protein